MNMEEVCTALIAKFGGLAQFDIAVEELSELSTAIMHHRRCKCSDAQVITEIADVIIVCEQLSILMGKEAVAKEVERKIARCQERYLV